MIMAILLSLHEPPEDEPQHDVANGFSNRSDRRPVSEVQRNSFRRRCRAAEKVKNHKILKRWAGDVHQNCVKAAGEGFGLLRRLKTFLYFLSVHLKARQPRHDVRDHRSCDCR
jgi:hypothetical protein